jgi:4a-hydroxytetrahydrobiopterin dehydratase
MVEKLTGQARAAALKALPAWHEVAGRDAIAREVTLATHDAGGLSERDIKLAQFIDTVAGS